MTRVRLGTRGSRLALAQTNAVAADLRRAHPGLEVEVVVLQTTGDRLADAPLAAIGGKGAFTGELEAALLDGRIDAAVHSLKDLPTSNPPRLAVGAVTRRDSWRDVLVFRTPRAPESLGGGDVVGTSSLRRAAQLRARFPGVDVVDLRGNVTTRLRRLEEGRLDAIVLAEAGLLRLGLSPAESVAADPDWMLPAPGQGALALQVRAGDEAALALVAALHDDDTADCCEAERALLHALEGGCRLPLGALAELKSDGSLRLRARIVSPDGSTTLEHSVEGPRAEAASLGREAASALLRQGARTLLAASDPESRRETPAPGAACEPRVLVTRDEDADGPLSRELRARGLLPVCVPTIRISSLCDDTRLLELCGTPPDWVVLTSAKGAEALRRAPRPVRGTLAAARLACVGTATADAARECLGLESAVVGVEGRRELLARLEPLLAGTAARVLVIHGNIATAEIADALSGWGCSVDCFEAYETRPVEPPAGLLAQLLREKGVRAVALCSPSAVEGLVLALAGTPGPAGAIIATIGPTTTAAARAAGLRVDLEASSPSFAALAHDLAGALCPARGD
jgi:hydroxymethylbilane synthase